MHSLGISPHNCFGETAAAKHDLLVVAQLISRPNKTLFHRNEQTHLRLPRQRRSTPIRCLASQGILRTTRKGYQYGITIDVDGTPQTPGQPRVGVNFRSHLPLSEICPTGAESSRPPTAISVVVNSSTNAARSRFGRKVAHGNTSAIVCSSPVGLCVTRFRSSRASASNASERSSSRSASLSRNDEALRRRSSTSWPGSSRPDVQWRPLTGRSVSVRAATSMPASQPGARPPSGGPRQVVSTPLR